MDFGEISNGLFYSWFCFIYRVSVRDSFPTIIHLNTTTSEFPRDLRQGARTTNPEKQYNQIKSYEETQGDILNWD